MDLSFLIPTVKKYKNEKGGIIAILQEAQSLYGYLPKEAIEFIASETGIKPAKIYSVATFYAQFRLVPSGKHLIMLCQGTACHVNGSNLLFDALSKELGIPDGGTTDDGLFTLSNVACLGCCSLSPAMMIDGETYGNLTGEKAVAVVRGFKNGTRAGREGVAE